MMQSELVEQAIEASELGPKPRGALSKTQVIPPFVVRAMPPNPTIRHTFTEGQAMPATS